MKEQFKLNDHKVNPVNDLLEIIVADEKGAGGAHHQYLVAWPGERWPSHREFGEFRDERDFKKVPCVWSCVVQFQDGPIKEKGINGITQEVLLTIVKHRLECFQAGPYACEENATALLHVIAALEALKARTRARQERGVEGTHTV